MLRRARAKAKEVYVGSFGVFSRLGHMHDKECIVSSATEALSISISSSPASSSMSRANSKSNKFMIMVRASNGPLQNM